MSVTSNEIYQEQLKVQRYSQKFRTIEDYDLRLEECGSHFRIRSYLHRQAGQQCTRWADVPSGAGVALHQGVEEYGDRIDPVGVDLIPWDEKNLPEEDMIDLRKKYDDKKLEKLLHKKSFQFIQGDMKTVVIPGGADLITAMCGLYYHEDPLGVWNNLFNQLRLGGVFVAHFMFPKKRPSVIENYKLIAAVLKNDTAMEIYFSNDKRDVVEAVLLARKINDKRLKIETVVKSVEPYTVSHGRHDKFQIKVVDYKLDLFRLFQAIE